MEKTPHHNKSQKQKKHKREKTEEPETVHLLENAWFFGNSLNSTPKIVRCFSEPAPSSTKRTTEMMFAAAGSRTASSDLQRTPSLPPNIWREDEDDWKKLDEEEEDDDDDGPRMGDLIRQATMPSNRRLSRLPSLPPQRLRRESSPVVVIGQQQQKGPTTTVSKLTRRASLDPSLLLPPCPKHASSSKGLKQASPKSTSSSRHNNHHHHHHHNIKGKTQYHPHEIITTTITGGSSSAGTTPTHPKAAAAAAASLRRTMSLTLSNQEVRGFRDLGFSFDNDELVNGISCLEIKEGEEEKDEQDDEEEAETTTGSAKRNSNNKNPSMSEAWNATRRSRSGGWSNWTSSNTPTTTIPKWSIDSKGSSSAEDMKAQIKFWARAVASNVR